MSALVNIETMRNTNCTTARTYQFEAFFYGASDALGPSELGENGSFLNLRLQSATLPQASSEPIEVNVRAFTYKEVGGVSWNDIEFTCYETDQYPIIQQLYAYHNQQFDYRTGTQRSKCEIEQTIDLVLLDISNNPIATWKVHGGLISEYTQPELSNDKAGAWEGLSFTVFYDFAELLEGPNVSGPGFNPTIGPAASRAQSGISNAISEANGRVGNQFG